MQVFELALCVLVVFVPLELFAVRVFAFLFFEMQLLLGLAATVLQLFTDFCSQWHGPVHVRTAVGTYSTNARHA